MTDLKHLKELYENHYIMRVLEQDEKNLIDPVFVLYLDENTGENVCFLPYSKNKILQNIDILGYNKSEWAYVYDLIDDATPMFQREKSAYLNIDYFYKLPNNSYIVKNYNFVKSKPEYKDKFMFIGFAVDKTIFSLPLSEKDYKPVIKKQLEDEKKYVLDYLDSYLIETKTFSENTAVPIKKFSQTLDPVLLKKAKENFLKHNPQYNETKEYKIN